MKLFKLAEEFEEKYYDNNRAENWVNWLKSLESLNVERPIKWKSKQEKGTSCCWCGLATNFVGVEHIIPRSAGGPPIDRWNLAWSCYPCNHTRGNAIGVGLSDNWISNYKLDLGDDPNTRGWLYLQFQSAPEEPIKEELIEYFNLH